MTASVLACELESASFAVVHLEGWAALPHYLLIDPPQQSVLIYPAHPVSLYWKLRNKSAGKCWQKECRSW